MIDRRVAASLEPLNLIAPCVRRHFEANTNFGHIS